jgi:hypothetical protein
MARRHSTLRLARAVGIAVAVTLGAGLLARATPAAAQEPHGLSVVAGGGYEMGGPGPSLARSLTAEGLGDSHLEGSGHITQYPQYYEAGIGLAVFLGAHYRFRGPYSVDVLASNGSRGHAEGFDNSGPDRLLVRWSSGMLTATAGLHLGPLRLAVGPTVNMIFWKTERNFSEKRNLTTSILGGTAEVSVRIPTRDVLVALSAGVRTFGTADLSPVLDDLPLTARYRTWFVGLTVMPLRPRY